MNKEEILIIDEKAKALTKKQWDFLKKWANTNRDKFCFRQTKWHKNSLTYNYPPKE